MVAAAIVGSSVVGGLLSSDASQSAANTQANAANNAAAMQQNQFNQMRQSLQPYMDLGSGSIPQLMGLLNSNKLNAQFSFNPTQQQLEQTPGYQFALQQGLKGVNNSMSARGLGNSGAQAKAITQYATGLADQTYQQQYNNALQNFMTNYGVNSNQFGRLGGLLSLGENAAAGVGNAGLQTASNAGNFLTSGANAQAAGTIGSANAINNGLSGATGGFMLNSLLNPNMSSNNFYGAGGGYQQAQAAGGFYPYGGGNLDAGNFS